MHHAKNRLPILILALSCLVSPAVAAEVPAPPDSAAIATMVRTLSAPDFAGRGNGTVEAFAAADTVAAWFAAAGLAPPPDGKGWFRDFPLPGLTLPGRNVLGWLPGAGALADEIVLIGAHYDHLGKVASVDGAADRYFPGADDNASGVAVLVETARILADRARAGADTLRRSVMVAGFAGEEIGLLGSRSLARRPVPHAPVAMINIDTVGRLRGGRVQIGGLDSAASFAAMVARNAEGLGLGIKPLRGDWAASDQASFLAAGVPSLFFFTGPYPEYHTPEDRWPLVSFPGMVRVASLVAAVARDLTIDPRPVVATIETDTAADAMSRSQAPEGKAERAWLGIIPDFTAEGPGVRLGGVMPGSPAESAGLRKGDLLVEFAGEPVADLPALTVLLRTHAAGERVAAVVEREGRAVEFAVTLKRRRR